MSVFVCDAPHDDSGASCELSSREGAVTLSSRERLVAVYTCDFAFEEEQEPRERGSLRHIAGSKGPAKQRLGGCSASASLPLWVDPVRAGLTLTRGPSRIARAGRDQRMCSLIVRAGVSVCALQAAAALAGRDG
jgi:hypothetical protein